MLLEKGCLALCALAICLMMLVGAADVVLGAVFGWYLSFKVDLSGTLLAASIFLAWPLVQRERSHITVDLFTARAPDWFVRTGRVLSALCGLLLFGLIAWGAWMLALNSVSIREVSPDTSGYPIWPWKLACAVGVSLTVAIVLGQSVTSVRELFRGGRGEGREGRS